MKKYILLTVLTIISFTVNKSFAQTSIDIGFKAGLSVPDLSNGGHVAPINGAYSSRLGEDAAVNIEFHFSKHFSIQPQLEYSVQGSMKNGDQAFAVPLALQQTFIKGYTAPSYLYANYYSLTQVNYLMFPILAKYSFNISKRWEGYIAAGPSINTALDAKYITSGSSKLYFDEQQTQPYTTIPVSFIQAQNIKNSVQAVSTTFAEYLALDYKLANNNNLLIEAGENYGSANIKKDGVTGKVRTGAAVINFGYQFRFLGGKTKKAEQVSDLSE